ncbi:MAG: 3-hydroxyacyl-CoA dehydrogenase NAD-binding domain-containing protein [Thermoplasmata archaeon]
MVKVLVVGAGTMGRGIATVCAISGNEVYLNDLSVEILKNSMESIKWSLSSLEKKGKLPFSTEKVMERIKIYESLENVPKDVEIIIEAVVEDISVKRELFKRLEEMFDAIMATNTSSIPIDDISTGLKNRKNIVGMHFFNPPTLIKLVEIIKGKDTSQETFEKAIKFAKSLGMETILVEKDIPGFVVNRINLKIFDSVLSIWEKGASINDIDSVAKYRLLLPMGFFELFDFIGIDVLYNVFNEIRKKGFLIKDHKILLEMIKDGKIGMKSGIGFYKYDKKYQKADIKKGNLYSIDPLDILSPGINEASWIISQGIATLEDVEKGQKIGMGYGDGILKLADGYGLDNVFKKLIEIGIEPDSLLKLKVNEGKIGMKSGEGFYKWDYKKLELPGIIYEKRGDHAFITFNRPEKLNSLDLNSWRSLKNAMEMAERDNVISIFFTGNGRAFCTGDDIRSMYSLKNMEESKQFFSEVRESIEKLIKSKQVLVGLVNGYAYGGGAEMLFIFDIVISSEKARFAFSESKIGAIPPIAITLGIDLVGRKLFNHIILGDEIDPIEALNIGFVDLVLDEVQMDRAYYEYVRKIESIGYNTINAIKETMNMSKENLFMEKSLEKLVKISMDKNFKEGMKKFLEK